jgi:hypothetical protein
MSDVEPKWEWLWELCPKVYEIGLLLPEPPLTDHCVELRDNKARENRQYCNFGYAQEKDIEAREKGLKNWLEPSYLEPKRTLRRSDGEEIWVVVLVGEE